MLAGNVGKRREAGHVQCMEEQRHLGRQQLDGCCRAHILGLEIGILKLCLGFFSAGNLPLPLLVLGHGHKDPTGIFVPRPGLSTIALADHLF